MNQIKLYLIKCVFFILISFSYQNSETSSLIEKIEQSGSNVNNLDNKFNNNKIEYAFAKVELNSENENKINNNDNIDNDQKEFDFFNTNETFEYAYEINKNYSLFFDENDKDSIVSSDVNQVENSQEENSVDSPDTDDDINDTDEYFQINDKTNEDNNETDEDQVDYEKEMLTNLVNENENTDTDLDEEPKQFLVISLVDSQSEQESDNEQQQQSDDDLNNPQPNNNNELESSETKPLILFKIRPIQRVFDRVLDTESDYYYKLLEMYEKNALDSENKYYKRIYRRFSGKIENDHDQIDNDLQQIEINQQNEDEEEGEEDEEREGEFNIDEILYRKTMLDNGENFRNEMMQLIMNKIQRIETLIISSFQLLLVLSIFLIVVQFLILLNNLMRKSKHRVYQHRLIAKPTNNNYKINDSYGVKSKQDTFNV